MVAVFPAGKLLSRDWHALQEEHVEAMAREGHGLGLGSPSPEMGSP